VVESTINYLLFLILEWTGDVAHVVGSLELAAYTLGFEQQEEAAWLMAALPAELRKIRFG
jgi:hypothetical protein